MVISAESHFGAASAEALAALDRVERQHWSLLTGVGGRVQRRTWKSARCDAKTRPISAELSRATLRSSFPCTARALWRRFTLKGQKQAAN